MGHEFKLNLSDKARSGALWQLFVKPAAHSMAALKAAAEGAFATMTSASSPMYRHETRLENLQPEQQRIWKAVEALDWYHTIDLRNGLRTPGRFNHLPLLNDYRLPERLDGMRALDVATMDGFWAFEMEKRGAAEVFALDVAKLGDLDIPPLERRRMTEVQLNTPRGSGFMLAKEILNSKVERRAQNVYELSPETTGKFDFVMMGDLLLHLMNPVKAAANVCSVTSGVAHIVECFNPYLPKNAMLYQGAEQGTWWGLSFGALERILWDAGFRKVELVHKFRAPTYPGQKAWMWRAVFRCTN